MGAEVNAGTGKETTSVYSRFLDGQLERAFDLLQDMVLHPAYPDIDSERQVVIEEIAMYEDEPQDKVHDVLAGALFGEHPLGRPIIGRADVVSSVPVPNIAAWHDSRYVPGGIVVAAAGNVDHDRLVALVEGAFNGARRSGAPADPAAPDAAGERLRFHRKDTEQYHLCLGAPGLPRGDDRRFALRILDTILGGSHLLAALPGGAREARPGLLGLLVHEPLRRLRPGGGLRGHPPRQRGEALDVIGAGAATPRSRTASPPRSSSAPART